MLTKSDCAQVVYIEPWGTVYANHGINWVVDISKLRRPPLVGEWLEVDHIQGNTLIPKRIVKEPKY